MDADGGADAGRGASDGASDATAAPEEAGAPRDAGPQNVSCASLKDALFCADFELAKVAPFGFTMAKTDDAGALTVQMDSLNGGTSNVLKATIDTSGILDAAPSDTFVHSDLTVPADAGTLTIDFDFRVETISVSYTSFGDIHTIGGDSLGVGANQKTLGQAYGPTSGAAILQDTRQWHHVHGEGHYGNGAVLTTIDGVVVQTKLFSGMGLQTRSPQLSAGIYSCAKVQDFENNKRTTVYVDNVVVRAF